MTLHDKFELLAEIDSLAETMIHDKTNEEDADKIQSDVLALISNIMEEQDVDVDLEDIEHILSEKKSPQKKAGSLAKIVRDGHAP